MVRFESLTNASTCLGPEFGYQLFGGIPNLMRARYVIQEFVSKVRIEWENTIHVVNFTTTEESTL